MIHGLLANDKDAPRAIQRLVHLATRMPESTRALWATRFCHVYGELAGQRRVDIAEIQAHMVMVDDTFGFCPGCREIGIKVSHIKESGKCPKCAREFKYVTSREKTPAMVARTRQKLPALTFVDYDDYERLTGKKKAETLFKDIP